MGLNGLSILRKIGNKFSLAGLHPFPSLISKTDGSLGPVIISHIISRLAAITSISGKEYTYQVAQSPCILQVLAELVAAKAKAVMKAKNFILKKGSRD